MRLEEKIAQLFIQRKETLATAESCTGGFLADQLTNVAGSSAYFMIGIIAYDNAAKEKILKVPAALIQKHGAVSGPVAEHMANNVRKILKTHGGISVTGIAGPGGGTKNKPVGLVFIAASYGTTTIVEQHHFKGSRQAIKKQSAAAALKLLLRIAQ